MSRNSSGAGVDRIQNIQINIYLAGYNPLGPVFDTTNLKESFTTSTFSENLNDD